MKVKLWIILSMILISGCAREAEPNLEQTPPIVEAPVEVTPKVDSGLQNALEAGYKAAVAAQTADTIEQWGDVASLWDEAISLLGDVPNLSDDYQTALLKIDEYQDNLDYAKKLSVTPSKSLGVSKTKIKDFFSQSDANFVFKNSPLTDGTPRLLGVSPDDTTYIELYGSTDEIASANISTLIGQSSSADLIALYHLSFLDGIVPGYDFGPKIEEAIDTFSTSGDTKKKIRAGDKIVSIEVMKITDQVVTLMTSVDPE